MKLLKTFYFILILLVVHSFANAKPLPPGTGNSIPANILFLVDKSQSMHDPATGNNKRINMRPPTDVVGRGDGNYFVSGVDESGYYYWNASQNKIVQTNSIFGGKTHRAHGFQKRGIGSPVQIEYHEGKKLIYALADARDYGMGNNCKQGGFFVYTINPSKGDGGRQGGRGGGNNSPNGSYNYYTSGPMPDGATNCAGSKKDSNGWKGWTFKGKTAISMHENKLWIVTAETAGIDNDSANGMIVIDISTATTSGNGRFNITNNNGGWGGRHKCPKISAYKYFNESIDVVRESGDLYMYSKDNTARPGQILKQKLDANGCMDTSSGAQYTNWNKTLNQDNCGSSNKGGASIVVKDEKIYTTGYFSHTICKYSFSGDTITLVKKVGISDSYATNDASLSDVYLNYPMGIDFGKGSVDHENTLFVVSRGRMEIAMLDKNNLSYKDHFGETGVSLFQGAKDAISFVLNDSATTQQAHFGIGFWHMNNGKFEGFYDDASGNVDYTRAKHCTREVCLDVGINPKGAQQILDLFQKDNIHLGYKTRFKGAAAILNRYFTHVNNPKEKIWNPHNDLLKCQTTAIIIIGDGEIGGNNNEQRAIKNVISALNRKSNPILTYTVGYGKDVYNDNDAKAIFKSYAVKGGTHDPANNKKGFFIAETPADLKNVTDTIVQQILSKQVVFSAPSISSEVKRSGELFQGKFWNRTNKEWYGTILKTRLVSGSGAAEQSNQLWDAAEKMVIDNVTPDNRKIWTALPNSSGINNFHEDNVDDIRNLFNLQGNIINDYHRVTLDPAESNLSRCSGTARGHTIKDGVILDEDEGLINFVRGEDYFDFDKDCDLGEPKMVIEEDGSQKKQMIADIYNSNLLIVGNPKAAVESTSTMSEAYFRASNNYSGWASGMIGRKETIYAAANNGVLHAFDSATGKELWGFVPPLIIPKMPTIINGSLNTTSGGGTTPRFLLDGSAMAHDTYFNHPIKNPTKKAWYTLLMIPYGRAGAGFSLIDISDRNSPSHLYSILNDPIGEKIHRVDHTGTIHSYPYQTTRLNESDFEEIQTVKSNSSTNYTCDATATTGCYAGNKLTLKSQTVDTVNTTISVNGIDVTGSTTITETLGDTIFTFANPITHSIDTGGVVDSVRIVEIGPISNLGTEYDYRRLGETWGSPRVFRLPNNGPGDNSVSDDEYVAVLPGGFGNFNPQIGSNVYVIDWVTGKVKKEIRIADKQYDSNTYNDIVNSVPSTPVVVTSDAAKEAYSGALVYVNDLEGKITKINLTNMRGSYALDASTGTVSQNTSATVGPGISLYDSYTFFDLDASTLTNNRFNYHSLDAGIGIKSRKLWLYGGTGDYMNLNDTMVADARVNNVLFGIKDKFFPYFGAEASGGATNIDNLSNCKNMTGNTTDCPDISDRGWYIELDDQKKVTAEPTLAKNVVYYPIFKPIRTDPNDPNPDPKKCGAGEAYICAYDADCGRNLSGELGTNSTSHTAEKCYYVGTGVLSKIISFGAKLYANISGESINAKKDDIVVIDAIDEGLTNYRSSWRQNF